MFVEFQVIAFRANGDSAWKFESQVQCINMNHVLRFARQAPIEGHKEDLTSLHIVDSGGASFFLLAECDASDLADLVEAKAPPR